ncbi:MAG TPA: serine--tRNA ligase [Patescibacteria group bacterium]|nr:serine--tRNA ligase [Patescibacteria group bacterium]
MLDIKYIREHADEIKQNNKNRGVDVNVDRLLDLDTLRRDHIKQIDELRAQRNQSSKGKPSKEEIDKMRKVGDEVQKLESDLAKIDIEYHELFARIPNLTHPDSPVGGEEDFKVLETHGEKPKFDFEPKDHEQLMLDLGVIDFERGAKVAASKFYFAKADLVRLNWALVTYGAEMAARHGFVLMETPDMAKNEILSGIGFNPRGEEKQVYNIADSDLSLIGTAEITVGGFHSGEVLDLSDGPKKYAAISHCFRTEAGAYGRTSKGLYRVHQFTKLELFVFCKPEESERYHQEILEIEKEIVNGLGLPYQVIDIPTGDLGGPAYRKYDIEAWMIMKDGPASPTGEYGEITSASNCTDYQARRLNIKYRKNDGATEYVHTLNGTAIVTSRFPIAIFENFQTADGSILVPEVLRKYLGKERISK